MLSLRVIQHHHHRYRYLKSSVTFFDNVIMSSSKRQCLVIKIGTHNGCFHCDDAMACAMLLMIDEYKSAIIVRTRQNASLDDCDLVVDVGAEYDPENHRYDHHQKEFKETMNSLNPSYKWTTKLSSAGLVYYHFGKQVIAGLVGTHEDSELVDLIYRKVYSGFVEAIDAVDNGISQTDGTPRYTIGSTLSSRVGYLNAHWNEKSTEESTMVQFKAAIKLTGDEFKDRVNYYAKVWYPARHIVSDALKNSLKVHESGKIIVLEQSCPWKDHFFDIEALADNLSEVNFVIFKDATGDSYRIQAVPVSAQSFELRMPLNKEWFGLRDVTLCDNVGVPDCIFVHANGFIGGAKTYEAALHMAEKSIIIIGNGDQK